MALSHVSFPVTDTAGNLAAAVTVTLLLSETQVAPTNNFYNRPVGGNPLQFPCTFRPGIVDLWSDTPVRVDVFVTLPNNATVEYQGIDLLPRSDNILYGQDTMEITSNAPSQVAALVSTGRNSSAFQVIAPTATHQHAGDSTGSVVLTNEDAKDFNPQQTWVGYHAGENDAFDTTGSTAVGSLADLGGTLATIIGGGFAFGDYSTLVSAQNSSAGPRGTVVGADNSVSNSFYASVIGSDNLLTATSYLTVVGSNNTLNTQTSTYIGDLHSASSGTDLHTMVGHANKLYALPISQVPVHQGYGLGTTAVAANLGTGTDWFGAGSYYATGYNDEPSSSQSGMVQGNVQANLMLQVLGNASMGAETPSDTTTGLLAFYGGTPSQRTVQSTYPTDTTSSPIPAMTSLMTALNSLGLIRSVIDTNVSIDTTKTGTLEFATTGQACQWSNPSGSTGYQATNPFVLTGSNVALAVNTAVQQFGVFSTNNTDTIVTANVTFDPTATTSQKSGILIRSYLNLSGGHAAIDGLLIAQNGIYPVTNGVVGSSLIGYSVLPGTASITVKSTGTTITVIDTTGTPVTKATLTSSYNQTKVKVGFMLSKASTINAFSVSSYF